MVQLVAQDGHIGLDGTVRRRSRSGDGQIVATNSGHLSCSRSLVRTPASMLDQTGRSDGSDNILPSLSRSQSSCLSQCSVRWNRNASGRWPSLHKAHSQTVPYAPEMRIRSLICNWPGHFCSESLIMVPAGSEPLAWPYRMTVCCDLRARRDDLRNKSAYLVAYDAERLRKRGAGVGVDALEASKSWAARYCVCSDVVPLKRQYGEVQITLMPPDSAEGTALALLRVVTVSNPSDLQDWHAIGDPVVVQVDPRLSREDRKGLQRLQRDLEESQKALSDRQLDLEATQGLLETSREARVQLQAEARQWKFEAEAKDRSISELEAALQKACSELEASQTAARDTQVAAKLRTALDHTRREQLKVSEESGTELQVALMQARRELEAANEDATEISQALKESRSTKCKAQAALRMHQTMSKAQRHQLWERSQMLEHAQKEAMRAREEAEAANEASCELRAAVEHARLDAEVWEEAASSAEITLARVKEELAWLSPRSPARSRRGSGANPSSQRSSPQHQAKPGSPSLRPATSTSSLGATSPQAVGAAAQRSQSRTSTADVTGAAANATAATATAAGAGEKEAPEAGADAAGGAASGDSPAASASQGVSASQGAGAGPAPGPAAATGGLGGAGGAAGEAPASAGSGAAAAPAPAASAGDSGPGRRPSQASLSSEQRARPREEPE